VGWKGFWDQEDSMPKQYMVELAQDERDELEAVLKSSTRRAVSATKLQRARILLAVDQGVAGPALTDMQVVDALGVTERTCQHVRRRAVEQGPMKALERRPRPFPPVPKKLDGEKEAASGSGGLFGSTGRPRSVDREAAGGRAGAT
jgi:hypothetical protein